MTQIKSNIPKIRFKEFSGEWEEKKLGEFSIFLKGKGISKADIVDDGNFECIRYGELYTKYGETIINIKSKTNLKESELIFSEENDVIIPASGETQIDIATASCVLNKGIALGGDLNIIRTDNNGVFLSYYLNSKKKIDIARLSQGISVVHLYSSQLKTLKINIPQLPEQQKIASFLSLVDEKIENIKEKKRSLEEYKKGVMQKIFSQEIRFKDENGEEFGEWEEKKLGDVIDLIIDNRGKTPPISNNGIPLIEVNAIGNKNIKYNKISKYVTNETYVDWFRKYLEKGDILFSTVGATGLCSIYEENIKSAVAQNIVGLRFNNSQNYEFMFYLLTEKYNNHKFKKIEMGAVQPSVKVSQMIHLKFFFPTFPEQQKIADFLSGIDEKIEKVSEELGKVEEFKKGLLQGMFV